MNVVTQILDGYPFQMVLAANMFAFSFPKRERFWIRFVVHLLPMLLIYDFSLHSLPPVENYLLSRLMLMLPVTYTVLGIWFCYRCSPLDALYCTATAHPAQNIVFNLYWIAKIHVGFEEGSLQALPFSLTLMAIVYTAVYFCFAKRMLEWEDSQFLRRKMVVNASIVMLFVIILNGRVPDAQMEDMVYISYVIGDLLALIMQFGLSVESSLERRYAVVEQLLYQEQKKQSMIVENVELINRKCHDLKHQIAGLRRMESDEERNAYLQKIENAVMIYESDVRTGNRTLDLILMDKLLYCREHNIKMTFVGDGSKLSCLDTMDLYSLLGNALDNAIESVIQEPEEDKRIISFRVGGRDAFLSIHLENYVREPVKLSSGLPLTTKRDVQYHGYGMLSMQRIAEKYHGSINIRTEEHLFCLDILIPIS